METASSKARCDECTTRKEPCMHVYVDMIKCTRPVLVLKSKIDPEIRSTRVQKNKLPFSAWTSCAGEDEVLCNKYSVTVTVTVCSMHSMCSMRGS